MARLPSVYDRALPTPQPAGGVAHYQPVGPSEAVPRAYEQSGRQIFAGSNVLATAVQQEQERFDVLKAEEAFNKLRNQQLQLSIGDDGFSKKMGSDAVDPEFRTDYLKRFDAAATSIGSGLNDRQRTLFNSRAQMARLQYTEDLIKHIASQRSVYAKSVYEGALAVEIQNASESFGDPAALAISKRRIAAMTMNEMARLGLTDPDAVQAAISKNLGRLDLAGIVHDMGLDPGATAAKLASDPSYGENLDPVTRERLIVNGIKTADVQAARRQREQERADRKIGEGFLKEAFARNQAGTLDRGFVEKLRPFVKPTEYSSMLQLLRGEDVKDDSDSYAILQKEIVKDPQNAWDMALSMHQRRLISNSTLNMVRNSLSPSGPKDSYQRNRQYIIDELSPSSISFDPAPRARLGLAVRDFDDWSVQNPKASGAELRDKAEELIKKYQLLPMKDMAEQTGMGVTSSPDKQLEDIRRRAEATQSEYDKGRLKEREYIDRMEKLNKLRKAAEAAKNAGNK